MTSPLFLEIDDAGLRYQIDGTGNTTIVLIHEMGGSLESWDRFVPLITDKMKVLRFDMRGFGLSSKVRGSHNIDRIVDDLVALLEHLNIRQAHVVGMAVGGAVATRFAICHPTRTASLTAIGPALGIAPAKREAIRSRADLIEQNGMAGIVDEELALSYPVELRDDNALLSYRARWLGNDPSSYAATYRMLASLDMLQSISSIQCGSLFLAGTLDPLRPPDMIEPLARVVPNAKFKAIWSGHVMAWQSPRLLHQETSSFWNEVHTSTQPHGALP